MIPYLLVVRIHYSFFFFNNSLCRGEKLVEDKVPVDYRASSEKELGGTSRPVREFGYIELFKNLQSKI